MPYNNYTAKTSRIIKHKAVNKDTPCKPAWMVKGQMIGSNFND